MFARGGRSPWSILWIALASCAPAGAAREAAYPENAPMTAEARPPDDAPLRGTELARADFVRAVLARNPTIEASRQAWRAAGARVRMEGALEINASHVALVRALREAVLAQLTAGRATAADSLQAEEELTHLEHDAIVLASERDIAVAQMNELLHRDPSAPLPPPPREIATTEAGDRTTDRASDRASNRAEIDAMRARADAEAQRAERASREAYPDFTVSTSYNSMWDMPEHRWMVGLTFNVPIHAGRRGGAVDEANAASARMRSELARMSDMARTEVVVARRRVDEARHVLHVYEERLLPIARQRAEAARVAFVSSQAPFTTVIDAEKSLRRTELEYQTARASLDERAAELDSASGRTPGIDERAGGDGKGAP